ncbi:phosphoglycerate mutase family protein [Runella slithyformis]|uniref:Phosphoglycerate mutase n=1 Tax=Runella slithyformis (strain ATCC 29530 / DSM 19594 / LMG 11500 / NCIMB 11436 / LSU 4) TaxID=761193 RepID=A0A7U4E5I3_RUNSL|nr:phosphoglycerate mutase family protein [Runella slithyformis]AEI48193.1 Phosphoglycerate mutase [Runella slithyformis DSM 19594]
MSISGRMCKALIKKIVPAISLLLMVSACHTSKIYIVRHAERLDDSADTPLSEAGHRRAKALSDSLYNQAIDYIFVSKYQRNRQTAQPLIERLGKSYEIYEPKPTGVILERLGQIKGKNAVVVGHSDTILEIAKGLGTKPSILNIVHEDYDNLFVITVKEGIFRRNVQLEEKTYGQKTLP